AVRAIENERESVGGLLVAVHEVDECLRAVCRRRRELARRRQVVLDPNHAMMESDSLLIDFMHRDKKATDGLTFVLDGPNGLEVVPEVDQSTVETTLRAFFDRCIDPQIG
ncbi:MAG: hypothetical protein RIT23_1088, partial [Actinomycetota bacterium]